MKHAYMFSLFTGSSLLLTIGVYDSLDSPNWLFTQSKLSVQTICVIAELPINKAFQPCFPQFSARICSISR